MSTNPTQVPPANPDPQPTPGSGAPPSPPKPPEDQHDEWKRTLDRLSEERDALAEKLRNQGTTLGRIRTALDLPKEADDEAWTAALKRIRDASKQTPPANSDGAPDNVKTFTEADLNRAMTEGRTKAEVEYQETLAQKEALRLEAVQRWEHDRVEGEVAAACANLDPPLRPSLVLAVLNANRYPWELVANEDGRGVRVIKRGDKDRAPYYSKDLMKDMKLVDALTVIAKDEPGVSLVHPRPGQRAGVGVRPGPAPVAGRDPSQMTPEEKVAQAFK